MIVCVCLQISDRAISREVHAGGDFSDVQLELGVSTQCGRCEGHARALVACCQAARIATETATLKGMARKPACSQAC